MADLEWLRGRLRSIAALDDHLANAHLASTGPYGGFDEPGSVRIAREILTELETTGALPDLESTAPISANPYTRRIENED